MLLLKRVRSIVAVSILCFVTPLNIANAAANSGCLAVNQRQVATFRKQMNAADDAHSKAFNGPNGFKTLGKSGKSYCSTFANQIRVEGRLLDFLVKHPECDQVYDEGTIRYLFDKHNRDYSNEC